MSAKDYSRVGDHDDHDEEEKGSHGHGHGHGHDGGHGHSHGGDDGDGGHGHLHGLGGGDTNHSHGGGNKKDAKAAEQADALKRLMIATCVSLCFMVAEIVGGALAHSLAVMSDAAHLLTDVSAFIISIMAIRLSQRAATWGLTFGFVRVEVIGALISVMTIWLLTGAFSPSTNMNEMRSLMRNFGTARLTLPRCA